MQSYNTLYKFAVAISIVTLFIISYATILVNNFKTPETTSDFFKNSNTYYYLAEIVKTDIRSKYPPDLRSNVIQLTAADALLNFIVTPNLVERISLPVLRVRARVAQLPLSFAGNNLVLNTQQYTQQLSSTLSSLNLPTTINDAAQKLIASVPSEITLVDTQKNPNSILATITQTRILFEQIQTILRIAWVIFIIALVTLFVINLKFLQRLMRGLLWLFASCGIIILLLSFIAPALANLLPSNPNPIDGALKDSLVNNMVTYYFSSTRTLSLVYILLAIGFYLLYRFLPYPTIMQWENRYLFPSSHVNTTKNKSQQSSHTPRSKKSAKK